MNESKVYKMIWQQLGRRNEHRWWDTACSNVTGLPSTHGLDQREWRETHHEQGRVVFDFVDIAVVRQQDKLVRRGSWSAKGLDDLYALKHISLTELGLDVREEHSVETR